MLLVLFPQSEKKERKTFSRNRRVKKKKKKENGLVYGGSVYVFLNNLVSASDG